MNEVAIVSEWIGTLAIAMMRPLGMLIILPSLNRGSLGSSLLVSGVALMIALPAMPAVHEIHQANAPASTSGFVLLLVGEMLLGALIGFVAAIPFWVVDTAGVVIDTMRGASMSGMINPLLGDSTSIFGLFFSQVLTVMFFVLGGFEALLVAFYESYRSLPPGKGVVIDGRLLVFLQNLWHMMYSQAITFAMPAIVGMLMVDMALGFVNRSAQQLNVFFLSMPLKSALTVFMVIISISYAFGSMQGDLRAVAPTLRRLMGILT